MPSCLISATAPLRFETRMRDEVCIVGNGRTVLSSRAGATIDRFVTVLRFNDYKLTDYEEHVGVRTTLWVLR